MEKKRKRICVVYQEDYPWDIRVEKIANVLSSEEHDVFIVCRNESRRIRDEDLNGIKIKRLPAVSKKFGKLNEVINFPAFFNPLWISAISDCVKNNKIDFIVVRDLPLALAAIAVGRFYKIPVFLDMAECYPELLRSLWKFGIFRFQNLVVRNPYFADVIEKIVIKRIDHIFVVVEEARERLIAKGADPRKVSIVSNTSPLAKFNPNLVVSKKDSGNKLKMIYVGYLTKGRGLTTPFEGLALFIKDHKSPISLCVVGTGEAEDDYKKLAKRLGIEEFIEFKGWVDNTKIAEYILSSDVGLVPHHVCGHWNNTVPNKLFDYMACGIPVLSSNTRPVSRIIKETGCGLVYKDLDPVDFRDCLIELTNESKRMSFRENGRRAVQEKYNWEIDSKSMVAIINTL